MSDLRDTADSMADDLLRGAGSISRFTGLTTQQVYRLNTRGDLPTFRLAGALCARKSSLREHIARLEAGRLKQAS